MIIQTEKLNQEAVYWGILTQGGGGDYTYSAPVEISCRWSTKTEMVKNARGEEVMSLAKVYVDRVLDVEGFLSLGELTGSTPASPESDKNAYAIIRSDETPNVKATEKLVSVRL